MKAAGLTLLLIFPKLAYVTPLVIEDSSFTNIDVSPYLSYFCTTERLSIDEIRASNKFNPGVIPLHFKYTVDHECWSRFSVDNVTTEGKYLYIEHQQTLTAEIRLFEGTLPLQEIGYEKYFAYEK